MSLLNWHLRDEQVAVWTDTLKTDELGEAAGLCAKVLVMPHLNMLVGCTGIHELFLRWTYYLSGLAQGFEVADLNGQAEKHLPAIWADLVPIGTSYRSTIRHWGWSDRYQRFVGFSFRSVDDFRSEVMPYTLALSPEPSEDLRGKPIETSEQMQALILDQQRAGLEAEEHHRVFIGGELLRFDLFRTETGALGSCSTKLGVLPGYSEVVARLSPSSQGAG